MISSIQKVASIASKWWGDVIENPRFNIGDDSLGGAFFMLYSKSRVENISGIQKELFISLLTEKISLEFQNTDRVILDVDYGPDRILGECANGARISRSNFPSKTMMEIYPNYVGVRYGYGAETQVLYATKDYWQREIETAEEYMKKQEEKLLSDDEEDMDHIKDSIERCKIDVEKNKANLQEAE